MRDQPRIGFQQATASVERRLEDLLLERLVADDLRDQQVGRLWQLDLPRPAGDERDRVGHPVGGEYAPRDLGDVAPLDRIDAACARPCRRDGEHAAPGADVEHDVSRPHRRDDRRDVVAGPAVVVQHSGMLYRVGPARCRPPAAVRLNEGAFLDQHVDDVHRGRKIGEGCLALEALDRRAERERLREQ